MDEQTFDDSELRFWKYAWISLVTIVLALCATGIACKALDRGEPKLPVKVTTQVERP